MTLYANDWTKGMRRDDVRLNTSVSNSVDVHNIVIDILDISLKK